MDKLISELKDQTVSLKEQYIVKTIEWTEKDYKRNVEKASWNEEQWAKHLGVRTRNVDGYIFFHDGFYNTKESKTWYNERNTAISIKNLGLEKYTEKNVRAAKLHYANSIFKLAERIIKKGLDKDNLTLKTTHIGVNIDTNITDGANTVKAFTILAYGDVQRPHYRYLVK